MTKVNPNVEIDSFELARLKECARAWEAVFDQLQIGNPDTFGLSRITGTECAIIEIKRLQACEADLKGMVKHG